jgi:hypothetical protein
MASTNIAVRMGSRDGMERVFASVGDLEGLYIL